MLIYICTHTHVYTNICILYSRLSLDARGKGDGVGEGVVKFSKVSIIVSIYS